LTPKLTANTPAEKNPFSELQDAANSNSASIQFALLLFPIVPKDQKVPPNFLLEKTTSSLENAKLV
jgi:hypothetical protein